MSGEARCGDASAEREKRGDAAAGCRAAAGGGGAPHGEGEEEERAEHDVCERGRRRRVNRRSV